MSNIETARSAFEALTDGERTTLLREFGYTASKARKPAAAKASVITMPVFDTGDARLDSWMREHWTPASTVAAEKRRAANRRQGIGKPPKLNDKLRRFCEESWNSAAITAWRERGVTIDPRTLHAVNTQEGVAA